MQTLRNSGITTNRIKRIPTIGDITRAVKTKTEHQEMKNMPNEQHEWNNRSNQLNPNNDAYYQSRGWDDKDDYDNHDD